MSAAEMAPDQNHEPYADPEDDPRFRALVDASGFPYNEALARLGYVASAAAHSQEDVEPAGPEAVRSPRRARRRGYSGRSYESDRDEVVPHYEQRSDEEIAAQQETTRSGAAQAWSALDRATAKRLGISVDEATELRVRRLTRAQHRRLS